MRAKYLLNSAGLLFIILSSRWCSVFSVFLDDEPADKVRQHFTFW